MDNETSLECREYFLSQRLPVTFVPPQIHRTNPAERAVRTGKNHFISSTHPDFPDDLWDRLLPFAEITLNITRPWRPDPSLSDWSGLHRLPYDFSAHPLHPPGQLCLATIMHVGTGIPELTIDQLTNQKVPKYHRQATDIIQE